MSLWLELSFRPILTSRTVGVLSRIPGPFAHFWDGGGGVHQVLSPRPSLEGTCWPPALLMPLGSGPTSQVTDGTQCDSSKALVMLKQRIFCPNVQGGITQQSSG